MPELTYYLLDVFTAHKYGGNQLAVFIDFENKTSSEQMLKLETIPKNKHTKTHMRCGFTYHKYPKN